MFQPGAVVPASGGIPERQGELAETSLSGSGRGDVMTAEEMRDNLVREALKVPGTARSWVAE